MRRVNYSDSDFAAVIAGFNKPVTEDVELSRQVAKIISDVRQRGDDAVVDYTRQFDRHDIDKDGMLVPPAAMQTALDNMEPGMRDAFAAAMENIREFHSRQKKYDSWQYQDKTGAIVGERVTALARVGVYVPGGKAAYPSSVLMNVIPAQVAGVPEIIMVSPAPGGVGNELVLAVAAMLGIDKVYAIGGAQAVAALAYGTDSIPRVDKITGPGNAYVAAAKRMVYGDTGIDMVAGPSEVLVICDASANPDWVAADLCAQAEHDEDARAVVVSDNAEMLNQVCAALDDLVPKLKRSNIVRTSIERNGLCVLVEDLDQAASVADSIAPEHLELAVAEPQPLLAKIHNAGAAFIGHNSAEVLGDYCAGPNHVLPTSGSARFFSPLSVLDFQKRTSVIQCDSSAASSLARVAAVLADGEGLSAHALSARLRVGTGN